MSMNQDLGFDPSDASKIVILDALGQVDQSIAKKFKLRALELAKQGVFGSLKTRKASLQNSYSQLVSIVDNFAAPVLVYGERGSGKRRMIEEFLTLQNFYRRLQAKEIGLLKVLKADLLTTGFSAQLLPPASGSGDLIFIENIDALSLACQDELLVHMHLRKKLMETGLGAPRLVFGTEKALSIMVIRQEFSRELFQLLTACTVFLPSLNERQEDFVHLLQSCIEDIEGIAATPPTHVVDTLSRHLWPENMDELKKVIKTLLLKKSDVSTWLLSDLPPSMCPRPALKTKTLAAQRFKLNKPSDISEANDERSRIKDELQKTSGNRDLTAIKLGISKSDLLKKLMTYGLR